MYLEAKIRPIQLGKDKDNDETNGRSRVSLDVPPKKKLQKPTVYILPNLEVILI